MYQPHLIAPFGVGLDTDLDPWLLPPDAFSKIENGHIHHGRIEKRQGTRVYGRLVHGESTNWAISNITQAATPTVTVTDTTGITDGDTVLFDSVTGMTEINGMYATVSNKTATTIDIDIDTSGFTAYAGSGQVYHVPGLRVMGLRRFIDPQNTRELVAFDTERACLFDSTKGYFVPLDDVDIFDSDETDYIWSDNWASTSSSTASTIYRMYFTNGKIFDNGTGVDLNGIRYYTGPSGTSTTLYRPQINSTTDIDGCKLLFAFKQRLLLLHTFEGGRTYPQRLRWCQIQNPDATDAWDDNVAGKGGFLDAPTGEQIISARPLQNGIIVQFTSSVWTISPTSDPALPFRFDKINDFRSCDGKMATVEYDRYVVAMGIRGITATDGVETKRIDNRIEDFVTDDVDIDAFEKVFAERSYANRRTWILYPSADGDDSDESDKALILDDESSAFSTYTIDMNVLGYSNNVADDLAAEDFTVENGWPDPNDPTESIAANGFSDENALSFFWAGKAEAFIGGGINGYVYVLEVGTSDNGTEYIFDLESAAWNPFKDQGIEAQMGYIDLFLDTDQVTTLNIEFYKNNDSTPYKSQRLDCLPDLNFIAPVTNAVIKNPSTSGVRISAPSHGKATGDVVYIYGVEGMLEILNTPWSITVIDDDTFDIAVDATNFTLYTGAGVVVERRFYRDKVWKRAYAGGIGYQHKIRVTSNGLNTPLKIHAFKPYFRPRGKRTI